MATKKNYDGPYEDEEYDDNSTNNNRKNIRWTSADWAYYYGVDEDDLEDAFDSDGSLDI